MLLARNGEANGKAVGRVQRHHALGRVGFVLDDVDPKKVAPGIFEGAFQNSGQVCLAIKRLYVHETVYDELCNEVVAIAKNTVVVDDGSKQGTKLGPL